jgi:hypothetical protein
VATIAHQERPEYLDRLAMLRDQVFVLDHMYMSVFSTCGWMLRLGVTLGLLISIHPALALLAVFALPTVVTSTWRSRGRRLASRTFLSSTTRQLSGPRSGAPAPMTSSRDGRRDSRRSSVRHGPGAWRCPSDNGRSSRWRGGSCATCHSCSCLTSPGSARRGDGARIVRALRRCDVR